MFGKVHSTCFVSKGTQHLLWDAAVMSCSCVTEHSAALHSETRRPFIYLIESQPLWFVNRSKPYCNFNFDESCRHIPGLKMQSVHCEFCRLFVSCAGMCEASSNQAAFCWSTRRIVTNLIPMRNQLKEIFLSHVKIVYGGETSQNKIWSHLLLFCKSFKDSFHVTQNLHSVIFKHNNSLRLLTIAWFVCLWCHTL